MISLQSLLASGASKKLPTIVLIACGVLLVLAFLIGVAKGYHNVGKGGFYWALAGGGFMLVYKFLGNKNPLSKLVGGKLAGLSGCIWGLVLVVGCVLVALLLRGIFAVLFQPQEDWIKKENASRYGFEFEIDGIDDFPETGSMRGAKRIVHGRDKIGIFGRLFGGLLCVINTAVVLAAVLGVALLVATGFGYRYAVIAETLKVKLVKTLVDYALIYALDLFTVGIVFWAGYKGFKTGAVGVTRAVLVKLGVLIVVIGGFAIPFISKTESLYVFKIVINRCLKLFAKMNPTLGAICGRAVAGALFVAVGLVIIAILNALLKMLTDNIEETTVIRVIDGVVASVVYVIIGVVLCAIMWAVLYIFDYCGIMQIKELFEGRAAFAKECYAGAEKVLKSFADRFLLRWAA